MGVRWHRSKWEQTGTSVGELALVLAIVGILSALATPFFLRYYQSSKLLGAAQQLTASLNLGRQFAIRQNRNVCVHITATAMHYHLDTCATAVWVPLGAGTDPAGNVNGPEGVTFSVASPIFNYLGAPTPGTTVTVTNTQNAQTVQVVIAPSGRICFPPSAVCP